MARIFVHHEDGKILSIASVDIMQEGLPHPYWLETPSQGVLEVPAGDPALANGLECVYRDLRVDVAAGQLVAIEAKPSSSVHAKKRACT